MNNKMLVLAAIGIVVATSLVMVGTVHSAEASGPGCPNKRAATAIVDPNAPNAVNTHTPTSPQSQLTGQTV